MTVIPSEENPLYSISTVAEMFDVKPYTVREWLKSGRINGTKVMGQWRIQKSECIRIANEEHG